MQIHHITLLTGNIPRSIQFYTEILGFRFVKNSVNQEDTTRRHVYYADYVATPGTVTTFIEFPFLGPRYDDGSYISGGNYYAPKGSEEYWRARLFDYGIENTMDAGVLRFLDVDNVELSFTFIDELIKAESINTFTTVPAEDQLLRLKSTSILVPDLDVETTFFQKLTGLPVKNNTVELALGQSIQLLQTKNNGKKRFGRGGIDHVALSATSIAEIHEIRKRGEEAHFHFEKEIDRLYFYSIYFKDPSDNRIEFATMTPGFTIDEDLDHLGEKLGLPERMEGERKELTQFYADENVHFKE